MANDDEQPPGKGTDLPSFPPVPHREAEERGANEAEVPTARSGSNAPGAPRPGMPTLLGGVAPPEPVAALPAATEATAIAEEPAPVAKEAKEPAPVAKEVKEPAPPVPKEAKEVTEPAPVAAPSEDAPRPALAAWEARPTVRQVQVEAVPPPEAAAAAAPAALPDTAPLAPTERFDGPLQGARVIAEAPAGAPSLGGVVDARTLQSWVVMLICATSLVMVLWHMQTRSVENANTGSRYATIESLVDHGTYSINKSRYSRTPDKVKSGEDFFSSKPPLLSTYGAGVYWVVQKITGYTITEHEGVVVWTVGMLTGWLSHLLFLIYFYRLSCLLLARQLAIIVAMACAGFAYLGVAWATAINNHSVGGALQVMGFYYAYRARNEQPSRPRHWLLAGLWMGLLPAFDLPSIAFSGFTGLYLLTKNWKWTLLLFAPAALPGLVIQPLLAHAATGSWVPAYMDASLKNYAGNYFKRASGIDALREPKWLYAFHMLLGHHGLFSMTPLFCFGFYEFFRRLVKKDRYRPEIGVWMATLLAFLVFYIRGTTNYGGWSVGMRWLVPVMPWLLMLFALWLDRVRLGKLVQASVLVSFVVSAYHVQDGLTSPFQFSVWHNFLDGTPNRSRLGPTWNIAKPASKAKPKPPPAKKPAPPPRKPAPPAPPPPPPK